MKLTQTKDIRSAFLFFTLLFAAATIPLANNLNSIAIVLFVIACVIQQPLKIAAAQLKRSRFWILPVIYYLWLACTFFWDTTGGFTIKQLEHYAILLFVPPALAIIPEINYKHLKYACIAFIAVTVAVCFICLFKSYNEYQVTKDYRVFYYHYLAGQMDLNAIFLSNFCLASVVWLFYFGKNKMHLLYKIPLAVFLVIMIFI
ncbi:MAG: hypothetical protein J7497_16445, partial [Chitinophagaceae bacterium]|nr:hypothetical protein [Chitinophagaceae bacterium]